MKLYDSGKQYNSKADIWEAIKTTLLEITPADVKNFFKSMDNILACY